MVCLMPNHDHLRQSLPVIITCARLYSPLRYLLAMGASTEAENGSGEKPADLIDPDCKELTRLFETGCA